ncbi:hypothetical protein APA_363 [Pseudanabaena sp. lw0831]|uniref:NACHT domain-containing protein n=1 Tax=Pseudanabaena sp. lw0831 TaxID=1357935 RepID=UPI0019154FCC|nr:HEAT repeat domain-containing protein [Pseudanabaena sp. lw0831]GBO52694.1 hypothetical protein APA_363 [Pseudanabaena sp. lw0831]
MQSSKKGLSGNLIAAIDLENILTEHLRTVLEKGEPRLVARLIIKQLHTRNFILCDLGGDSYGFVHRTFLEYFCAWEFVWQFKESQTLTIEQLIHDVFGNHWQDESWHEVLRLISGMIEPRFVAEIIDFLLEQEIDKSTFFDGSFPLFKRLKKEGLSNLLLAVDCFVEVRNKNLIARTSRKLLKTLQDEAEQEHPYKFTSELAIRLINNIAIIWQDSSETLVWLKKCLKSIPDSSTQGIFGFLIRSFISESAVQEIAKGWKYNTDTLTWLKDRALYDQNVYVRSAAVQEIDKGWKDDPDTLPLLKDRALNDQNEYVRRAIVYMIAKSWKDDPDTLPLLKDRALNDQNEYVRMAAVQEIAKGWKDDLQTFDFLCDRAINDSFVRGESLVALAFVNPRQTALEAILKHYSDKPQTLELLKTVSNNDPDERLKEFAKKELAKLSENPVGA